MPPGADVLAPVAGAPAPPGGPPRSGGAPAAAGPAGVVGAGVGVAAFLLPGRYNTTITAMINTNRTPKNISLFFSSAPTARRAISGFSYQLRFPKGRR